MNPSRGGRWRRILAGVVLVIGGPVLGATAFVLGNIIGWGGTVLFLIGWGVLSHRLIRRAGAGRWTARIGAVLAVVWTFVLPTLLIVVASSGPGFETS